MKRQERIKPVIEIEIIHLAYKKYKLSPYNCVKREIEKEPRCFPLGRINSGPKTPNKEERNHGSIPGIILSLYNYINEERGDPIVRYKFALYLNLTKFIDRNNKYLV